MGARHCAGGTTPLSVSITAGVRVTLHLEPQLLCRVCDISCCDVNAGASHRVTPSRRPARMGSWRGFQLLFPQGGGSLWAQNRAQDSSPPPGLSPLLSVPSKPKL